MFNRRFGNRLFTFEDNRIKSKLLKKRKERIKLGIIMETLFSVPPTTGFTYRMYHLTRYLIREGIEVVWIIANRGISSEEDISNLKTSNIPMYVIPQKDFYNLTAIYEILIKEGVDVLQFESAQTFLEIGLAIKSKIKKPIILEFHDIEATLQEAVDSTGDVEVLKYIQYISATFADHIICFTDLDYKNLVKDIGVPEDKISVIPNGIDREYFNYKGINVKDNTLVFLGNLFYPPNRQALENIVECVLPIIRQSLNNVNLKVIGLLPDDLRLKYKNDKNITFCGEIRDDELYKQELQTSTIGLCTVLSGSGMKIKILNYAGFGLPIVTTEIGSSGYEKLSHLNIVKNDAQSIAKEIIDLLSNKEKSKVRGEKLREEVIKYFSWNSIARLHNEIIHLVLEYDFEKDSYSTHENLKPLWLKESRQKDSIIKDTIIINV